MKNIIYKRQIYIDKINPFINKPVIKVITGIRRCGKSYFIRMIIDKLKEEGVVDAKILYINKESIEFDFIDDYKKLDSYISNYFMKRTKDIKYVFIDEIQEIRKWEKTIMSLFNHGDFDIYITGSNARLLSSELATLLSGRYIEFPIFTLSFDEFLLFRDLKEINEQEEFQSYLQFGGFPVIHHMDYNEEIVFQYIKSIYNTILLKDIVARYNIRNVQLLENLMLYVTDNIGNIFSARRIAAYLKSQKLNISIDTIQTYLGYLSSVFLIYKVPRYDIKGKRVLEIYEKYFLGDIGLKTTFSGFKEREIPGILENIVFIKLKQSGYDVFIGKYDDMEIDFIAQKGDTKLYIQVCYLLNNEPTIEREYKVLRKIKDNYPKLIVSMDNLPPSNEEGIIRMNIIDFLTNYKFSF